MLVIVVRFLLGDSPASDLYMPTFRNTLSVPSLKMEHIECSETSAYINQPPGNHPKENKQHSEQGESLKSRMLVMLRHLKKLVGRLYGVHTGYSTWGGGRGGGNIKSLVTNERHNSKF